MKRAGVLATAQKRRPVSHGGMKQGLLPVVNKDTRILILGSFPSESSLRKKEYYAYSQNQFWPIIMRLLGYGDSQLNYHQRIKLLLRNGIGLWDVIASCEREGSRDAGIRQVVLNNLEKFLIRWSNINRVYVNGRIAQRYYQQLKSERREAVYLPSSSPANAIGFDRKLLIWKKTLQPEKYFH